MTGVRDLPLSAAQRGLWLDLQLRPAHPERFNIATCTTLTGPVDCDLFARAIDIVVHRHSSLRAGFVVNHRGEPRQQIVSPLHGYYEFKVFGDLAQAERWIGEDLRTPFSSLTQPLCRFVLGQLPDSEWVWYAKCHHLILDGQGLALLRQDLCRTYAALLQGTMSCDTEADGFERFLRDEADYRESAAYDADRSFWTAAHRSVEAGSGRLRTVRSQSELNLLTAQSRDVPPHICAWIAQCAQRLAVEPSDILTSVVVLFLGLLTGERTVPVGLPVHGRSAEFQRLVAFCSNVLPLQMRIEACRTWRELVTSVSEQMRVALSHRRYRYEDLKQELGSTMTDASLLPAVVNIMRFPAAMEFDMGQARARLRIRAGGPIHGLSFLFYGRRETPDLSVAIDASSTWGDAAQLAALRSAFTRFIDALSSMGDDQPLPRDVLDDDMRRRLHEWSRGPRTSLRHKTFVEQFREAVRRYPEHTALRWNAGSLSYRMLDRSSDTVAARLRDVARPRSVIGVYMQRGPEAIIAFLAILKAGCIYLPVDPENPPARARRMIEDAAAGCVLTEPHRIDHAMQALSGAALMAVSPSDAAPAPFESAIEIAASDTAYVIYTSGSTGQPKGVVNTHAALANLAAAQAEGFGISSASRVIQLARPGFDASISEIAMALGSGASLYVASANLAEIAVDLADLLERERITVATIPPALLALLPAAELPELRTLVVAGEACPIELARRWSVRRRLINAYGPTETGVCATWGDYVPGSSVLPIGRPLANVCVHVTNAAGELVPPGLPGELRIGGIAVGIGYLNNEPQTTASFIPDPFDGNPHARCYRSGDLTRWLPDGTLEFLGRIDAQAKVRGFRVEPAEIEAALRGHPRVTGSAAVVRLRHARTVVDAYATGSGACSTEDLRSHLRTLLPDFMVPATITILDSLPLSLSGKLDRAALPEPLSSTVAESADHPADHPWTPTEVRVARILEDILNIESLGPYTSFFDAGGDSLMAIQSIMELRQTFATDFAADLFFLQPDVVSIAYHLESARVAHQGSRTDLPTDSPTDSVLRKFFE